MIETGNHNLEYLFHPRSVACVGVPSDPKVWTRCFLDSLIEFKFPGRLYPVNRKGGEIGGLKVYTSLQEMPGSVDYVISTVPASASPALVAECAAKGVKAIHFCTAGFRETGEEEGIRLEAEVISAARRTGVRVIGPNSMGLYCPQAALSFMTDFPRESGPVSFISQSGTNCHSLIREAGLRGVRFSKVISYGNACDLNEIDFIEYLAGDPSTGIIAMYLEGTRDGSKFRQALEKAAANKVVVAFKGGTTPAGSLAAASHTGSLAGQTAVWDALFKQLGVISVDSIDQLIDVLVTLVFMPAPEGKNAALLGWGGGSSVAITDDFERGGIKVPPLPAGVQAEIMKYTPIAGNILKNPVDYGQAMLSRQKLLDTLSIISRWEGIDFLAIFFRPSMIMQPVGDKISQVVDGVLEVQKANLKPMAVITVPTFGLEQSNDCFPPLQRVIAGKLPVYYSFASAANAIRLVLDNARRRREIA